MAPRKRHCAQCGRQVVATKQGLAPRHNRDRKRWARSTDEWIIVKESCPGAGKPTSEQLVKAAR